MSLQDRYKKIPPVPVAEGQRWYSLVGASHYMAVRVHQVRELIRAGKIKAQIVGRGYVLDKRDMDSFLEANKESKAEALSSVRSAVPVIRLENCHTHMIGSVRCFHGEISITSHKTATL